MPESSDPTDNITRLLTHLTDGSLAARLVQAYRERAAASMKTALVERLEEEKARLDGPKD